MKNLFNHTHNIIKYSLTIMAFALALATIFIVGFGFNSSAEFGGAYEITIDCFDNTKIEEYTASAEDVLDSYGYSPNSIFVEDREYCETLVIRYKSNSANNAVKIQADIVNKLALNENLVTVNVLHAPSALNQALKLLVFLGVAVVVMFIYLIIRFNWKVALTVVLNLILTALMSLSIFAISRIEISFVSLGLVTTLSMLSTILLMLLISKMQATQNQQDKVLQFRENYVNFANDIKLKAIIPTALILLVFVSLIFTFNRAVAQAGVASLVTLIIGAFMLVIFSPALLSVLNREKSNLTKKR